MSTLTTHHAAPRRPGTAAVAPTTSEVPADLLTAIAARAAAVDAGEDDVRTGVRALGSRGLLSLDRDRLVEQAAVLREVAALDMATAFSAWAQRMTIDYISAWGSQALRAGFLGELTSGSRAGATALAGAFQDALGLKELGVTAREDGGDVVLDGVVPWASNLFDAAVVVLPARTADGGRRIVAVTTDLEGVRRARQPELLALCGTASTTLFLDAVRIPRGWVLTDDVGGFLADVRPAFLLLQTAFCLGIADAALAAAEGRHTGPATVLADDHAALSARRDEAADRHAELCAALPREPDDVTRLRLEAGRLGVDAVRHEATVRGGGGYLAGAPTARRLREAAFLPIQSPTEAQLRWELTRSA